MDLESYILGVVLAEMPARFEPEALKAQAVAARTYTLKNCIAGYKHSAGTVCTRSSCCQAYKDPQEYLASGGKQQALEKVQLAVEATAGQVLMYNGELIDAAYFSCSGGSTEDAAAVWGYDVPYLQSVESPGEESASAYYRETVLSIDEFRKKLGFTPVGDLKTWISDVTFTAGGGVSTITICGIEFKGTKVRSLLGLRSTMFEIHFSEDTVMIATKGYGHRVGMSQYGADAMAVAGSDYKEILTHYFQGTTLTIYPCSDE